jgi:N-acetyl-alpha-D-muramate 1-phosphate uridylyltransferase
MKAMILAAGKGTRLRPLTDTCPKPLIKVAGKPLIVYHLENLKKAGITDIVINVHHLGTQIMETLGSGEQWGVNIRYSIESRLLETGGGISTALRLLGKAPFLIVNGDIWTDFDFTRLSHSIQSLGHLVLVNNPEHHPHGDFTLDARGFIGRAHQENDKTYTYSGIAVLHPDLFEGCEPNVPAKLSGFFDKAIFAKQLVGEHYSGEWTDVGNLERLEALEQALA